MSARIARSARLAAVVVSLAAIVGAGLVATPAWADANDIAVANSDIYEIEQGTSLHLDAPGLLLNDTTVSGGELEMREVQGEIAELTLDGLKGAFTFTPDAAFNGSRVFEYRIWEINTAAESDWTSVVIIVNPAPGEEGTPPEEPAPCEVSQPCAGDGEGTAGSGLDDPCAPADPSLPQVPSSADEAPEGLADCPLPPCDPNEVTTPESAPDCIPVTPPCDPNEVTTPENAPDCIPTPGTDTPSDEPDAGTDIPTLPSDDNDGPLPAAVLAPTTSLAQTGSTPNAMGGAGFALLLMVAGAAAIAVQRRRRVS